MKIYSSLFILLIFVGCLSNPASINVKKVNVTIYYNVYSAKSACAIFTSDVFLDSIYKGETKIYLVKDSSILKIKYLNRDNVYQLDSIIATENARWNIS